jgi:hypothetical protein
MQLKYVVLAGLLAVSLAGNAQANFLRGRCKCKNECCETSCCNAGNACCNAANACGPVTVNCIEWVQEQRQVCCTTYKTEQRCVTCTGYRCETYTVPEVRTVCCKRYVTEQCMECRTVCERIPYWTEKTVMKTHWVTQQCTEMRTRCVDKGHYECCEVPCRTGLLERLHKKDCCDPCACDCCPKTKTVQKWVPCKVTECCPVTVCKRVKVCEPCTVKVCCYKTCTKQVQVPVCKTRCITEQKQVTVNKCCKRMVPYTYTKTVCCRVPCQEMRTVTVCVPRCVQKQVNAGGCCAPISNCCR